MDSNESTAASGSTASSTGLIDVNEIALRELLKPDDNTVLGDALRRAADAVAKQRSDAVSAFNSAI